MLEIYGDVDLMEYNNIDFFMKEELGSCERWFRMLMEGAVEEIEEWV